MSISQTKQLNKKHLDSLVSGSAIDPEIISERGYYSEIDPAALQALGFGVRQTSTVSERNPALVIPYYRVDGNNGVYCLRPDCPRSVDDKKKTKLEDGTYPQKTFKYEMPRGSGNMLDCHPQVVPHLGDPTKTLFFTEGAKKADSLISKGFSAINLNGVFGWRGSNGNHGKTALPDFEEIALNGREVVLLFDSDVTTNPQVTVALRRFAGFLKGKGAKVVPVILPDFGNGKAGIDDYFVSGKTGDDLINLISYYKTFPSTITEKKEAWTTERYVKLFRKWGYRFRINDMDESLELNGRRLDDTAIAKIECKLFNEKVKQPKLSIAHAERVRKVIGDSDRYHPIKEFLNGLNWDGENHILRLSKYFADEHAVLALFLKKWIIGSVAKILTDGKEQNFMLVLGGPQGVGKSYFAKWLCPLSDFFLEDPIDPRSKDDRIKLAGHWVWECGELASLFRKSQREDWKRFITTAWISERKPYDKEQTRKPAIASLIGTINIESSFLDDPTGSRRFCVTELQRVNWDYAKDIDINQVWAQAVHIFNTRRDEKPWELDESESELQNEINESHTVVDPLSELLFKHFDLTGSLDESLITTVDILSYLVPDSQTTNRSLTNRLSTILRSNGLTQTKMIRKNGVRARFWQGVKQIVVEMD